MVVVVVVVVAETLVLSNWWLILQGQAWRVMMMNCQKVMEKATLQTQVSRSTDNLYMRK